MDRSLRFRTEASLIHRTRVFRITPVGDVATLVEKLHQRTWTACTAFQLHDVVFANDSFSPDGAQEYAILRDGRQIDSLTVSWCTRAELECAITNYVAGKVHGDDGAVALRTDHPPGPCARCA
jgi:hypothetical protein